MMDFADDLNMTTGLIDTFRCNQVPPFPDLSIAGMFY